MTKIRAIAAVAGMALAVPALAFVPWTAGPGGQVGASGSGSFFSWSEGGSDNGLFGSPRLIGDNFVFFPSGFRAQSVNGAPSLVGDRLQFRLSANQGRFFSQIRITEFGDYGIVGGGTVNVSGTMFVTDLNSGVVRTNDLLPNPAMPINVGAGGSQSGPWTAVANVNLPPPPFATDVFVVLNNNLVAISLPGGVAFIEKKIVGTGIRIEIIPAPGALALLGVAGLVTARRRR
jgi:hypothetical protein